MKNIHVPKVNFADDEQYLHFPHAPFVSYSSTIFFDKWIAVALITGIAFRIFRLGDAPFWLDETFTVSWIKLPWTEMLYAAFADNHLPLYFVLLKAWSAIAGISPFALRLPNVLLSALMIPLVAAIAWTIKDRISARWAAWLAALSPYFLQHAQEARMYPLLGLLAAAGILLLLRFITKETKQLNTWFFALNVAILLTHYYGIFFVGAEFLVLLVSAAKRWRDWLPLMGLSLLFVMAPMMSAKYLATPHAGSTYGVGLIALPGLIWSLISGYTLLPTSMQLHDNGLRAALPYLPVAIAAAAALTVIAINAYRSLTKASISALAGITGTVIFAPFIVGLFFDVGINPRYAIACTPAILAFIAAGCPNSPGQYSRELSAITLLAILTTASMLHLNNPSHGREDINAIGEWLDRNVPKEEEILITSSEMAALADFHWPDRRFITYPARKIVVNNANAGRIASELPINHGQRTIYIFGRTWVSDPDNALRNALKARYRECNGTAAQGVTVLCFIKPR